MAFPPRATRPIGQELPKNGSQNKIQIQFLACHERIHLRPSWMDFGKGIEVVIQLMLVHFFFPPKCMLSDLKSLATGQVFTPCFEGNRKQRPIQFNDTEQTGNGERRSVPNNIQLLWTLASGGWSPSQRWKWPRSMENKARKGLTAF